MEQENTVLITGLPAEGTTESEVRQYMSFCGDVDSIFLFLAQQMGSGAKHPSSRPSSAALVCFRHASSVAYAELLSGSLYQGKVIEIHRSTGAEAQQELFTSTTEPVTDGSAAALSTYPTPSTLETDAMDGANEAEDIPETMTGLWVRARLQRAARAVRAHAGQFVVDAREGMAKAKQGALSLELRAAHVVSDVREMREWVPVHGNGPTKAQYDYTPTQPQWGNRPAWVRAPRKD